MSLIRMQNHGEALVSTYGTNYQYIVSTERNSSNHIAFTRPLTYDGNCSCALNFTCTITASFTEKPIRGLKMGCTPTESLLASTLECFSNASCLDLLDEMTNHQRTVPLLPVSLSDSRFAVNATVSDLVKELFLENWLTQGNYSEYFEQCSPILCSYTYVERFNLVYTITYILGLFGGLTIVLKWICPRIVSLLSRIFPSLHRHENRVHPVSTIETTFIQVNVKLAT